MTPELEDALESVYWSWLKLAAPNHAAYVELRLNATGGDLHCNSTSARKYLQQLDRDIEAFQLSIRFLDQLNGEHRQTVVINCANHDASDPEEQTDWVERCTSEMKSVLIGLEELRLQVAFEAERTTGGRPKKQAARNVAKALAYAFVLGRGEPVTAGNHPIKNKTTGEYCRLVSEVLRILGVSVGDIKRLCEEIVKEMKEEKMEHLLEMHQRKLLLPFPRE